MISSQPNKVIEWLEVLKTADKPIVVFTTGAAGRGFYRILTEHGVRIAGFADNSKEKAGQQINIDGISVEVLSFQDTLSRYPDAYIVIPPRDYLEEITKQFTRAGYGKDKLVGVEFGVLDYIHLAESNEKACALLYDERSRSVFSNRLNFLLTGDESYMKRPHDDGSSIYFDSDIFSLSDHETVIDGGGVLEVLF